MAEATRNANGAACDDGPKPDGHGKAKNRDHIGDRTAGGSGKPRQLSLFHRFSKRIPLAFPFPSTTEATTMADAAEHDEELVDYDEEEVG